jgi:hypothetical protein
VELSRKCSQDGQIEASRSRYPLSGNENVPAGAQQRLKTANIMFYPRTLNPNKSTGKLTQQFRGHFEQVLCRKGLSTRDRVTSTAEIFRKLLRWNGPNYPKVLFRKGKAIMTLHIDEGWFV